MSRPFDTPLAKTFINPPVSSDCPSELPFVRAHEVQEFRNLWKLRQRCFSHRGKRGTPEFIVNTKKAQDYRQQMLQFATDEVAAKSCIDTRFQKIAEYCRGRSKRWKNEKAAHEATPKPKHQKGVRAHGGGKVMIGQGHSKKQGSHSSNS